MFKALRSPFKALTVTTLLLVSLACGKAGATPLDLQYQPALDSPQPSIQKPVSGTVPPLEIARTGERRSTAVGDTYGWQWLPPSISLSSKHDDGNSPQAAKIAQQEMDHQLLLEHRDPLLNDLPPALQTLPLSVNVGVKYHF